jgi:hypothetical protein
MIPTHWLVSNVHMPTIIYKGLSLSRAILWDFLTELQSEIHFSHKCYIYSEYFLLNHFCFSGDHLEDLGIDGKIILEWILGN